MMRIAYVSTDPGIPVFGCKGASVHLQEMVRAFLAKGAEVTLFSPRMEGVPPQDLTAARQHSLPPVLKGDADARARDQIALNRDVAQTLEAQGPFDLIYERHALFAHAAMDYARKQHIPSVLEVNAPLIDEQSRHRSLERIDDALFLACRAFAAAKQVVAVSPQVADYARDMGTPADRVTVEPNAVNPARFPDPAKFADAFCVGFLGTLKPWHDVSLIIHAFAILRQTMPTAKLLIVGDGPERRRLTVQADAAGVIDAVHFTGAVPAEQVPSWLARMHVGLATYRGSDPFYFSPLKLYEYMAAGLPSVVSRVGTLPDAIEEGKTGLSVPPDDAEALAAALAKLANDPGMVRAMGHTARARVLATQTWDDVADRVLLRAGLAPARMDGAA
ncbi:glycosyltransferase family 4 protein [uncultured Roseobacter sp.]|uniref:glycosyltransferase family 4 protein n=1 Tax=uncultured Roseobacter sp. TaxID=114847 RepID=UPI00261217BD|nr:glycosyltransferase family 4 protein [uncultured Roseobacter sp.]